MLLHYIPDNPKTLYLRNVVLLNNKTESKVVNNAFDLFLWINLRPIVPLDLLQSSLFPILCHPNNLLKFIAKIITIRQCLKKGQSINKRLSCHFNEYKRRIEWVKVI